MCKVLAFSNASKLNLKKTANVAGPLLLKTERDGFGYAAHGERGQFGEKYIGDRFKSRLDNLHRTVKIPFVKTVHEFFGVKSKVTGPAIFHGRTSTNDRGLLNCHPIRREGWSLIHNGVVTDHGPSYVKTTTNDSEDVLARLILGIEQVEAHLTGYYAFAAIDTKGRLHIGRDSIAPLHCAWSDVIESYVIATTPTIIETVSKELKLNVGPIDAISDNVYMILSGASIEVAREITPRGYGYTESRYATSSLGVSLSSYSRTYGRAEIERDLGVSPRASRYKRANAIDAAETNETKPDLVSEAAWTRDVTGETANAADPYEAWPDESRLADAALADDGGPEIERLDPSYRIYNESSVEIDLLAYYKMDAVNRALCTVFRFDGTLVEFDYETKGA